MLAGFDLADADRVDQDVVRGEFLGQGLGDREAGGASKSMLFTSGLSKTSGTFL